MVEAQARGPVIRFLRRFHNVLIYVLIGAVVVTGALQHWVDTSVIVAVVVANAIIGIIQEGKAEAAMAATRDMLAPKAAVSRDGRRVSVDGADLVPGGIVLLEAGDKVPADLRVLEARGLAAQEAILTREPPRVAEHKLLIGYAPPAYRVRHFAAPRRVADGRRPTDRDVFVIDALHTSAQRVGCKPTNQRKERP